MKLKNRESGFSLDCHFSKSSTAKASDSTDEFPRGYTLRSRTVEKMDLKNSVPSVIPVRVMVIESDVFLCKLPGIRHDFFREHVVP